MAERRRIVPYFLLGPGAIWLLLFFVVPLFYMGYLSLESGVVGNLSFDWHWGNYSNALSLYDTQFVRSFVYSGVATLICLSSPTRSPTRSPSGPASGATRCSSRSSRRSSPPT